MVAVVITQNEAIERAIAEALEHLPLDALVRGKIVAVKPNDTWASSEDVTGVTQPDTLRAVRCPSAASVAQAKPAWLWLSCHG